MEHHTTAKATKGNAVFCLKTCAALVSLIANLFSLPNLPNEIFVAFISSGLNFGCFHFIGVKL